jgi:hypothetical protein
LNQVGTNLHSEQVIVNGLAGHDTVLILTGSITFFDVGLGGPRPPWLV